MNPEAIEWLESISEEVRPLHFNPAYPFDGKLYSLKDDHEGCCYCLQAKRYGQLLVID